MRIWPFVRSIAVLIFLWYGSYFFPLCLLKYYGLRPRKKKKRAKNVYFRMKKMDGKKFIYINVKKKKIHPSIKYYWYSVLCVIEFMLCSHIICVRLFAWRYSSREYKYIVFISERLRVETFFSHFYRWNSPTMELKYV